MVLFDARGERLRPAPLEVKEGAVNSVAFGPEGQIAAGYGVGGVGGGGVVLFDARGERLRPTPLEVKEGECQERGLRAGGPDRRGIWRRRRLRRRRRGALRRPGERLRPAPLEVKEGGVTSVAFGPEGQIAAGYARLGGGGGVVLFDARGERLRPTPLEVKEGDVTSVAFGPEGQIAAGYGVGVGGVGGGVVLFDARGERLRPAPLEVKEGDVKSVAFGPEGQIAAGYGVRGGVGGVGGVVLFDARGERLRPTPLEVKEGDVKSVAFGPEGQIAAGYGGGGVAAAAWCSSTPAASGSDPRRWRSRRAMSRAWPSGRRARSPRDMAAAASAAWCSSTPGRAAPTRAAGGQGGRCHERGLRARGPDRRGIWRRRRVGGGVVLFDARGERLRPAPLEVKEGGVTSVAFGPEGQIAAGYGVRGVGVGVGGGVVLFDARGERLRPAPLEVKEGDVTSVAFGPEGQIAAGYGAASAAAAWCSSTPIPPRGGGRRGRSPTATSRGSSGRGTSPRPPTAARSDPCPGRMISPRRNGSRPRRSRRSTPRGERPHDTTRSETKNRPGTFPGSFRRGWSFPRLPQSAQIFKF